MYVPRGIANPFAAMCVVVESTDSTQEELRTRLVESPEMPEGTAIVTARQVHGRGRRGRPWTCVPDKGIALSILLRPTAPPDRLHWIPAVASMALHRLAVSHGLPSRLKWPNDIMIEGRKIAGILVESLGDTRAPLLILGIGINVNATASDFPPELQPIAGSLFPGSAAPSLTEVTEGWLRAFFDLYPSALEGQHATFFAEYLEALDDVGRRIRISPAGHPGIEGTVTGIDDAGYLLVQTRTGIERILAGEIEWVA